MFDLTSVTARLGELIHRAGGRENALLLAGLVIMVMAALFVIGRKASAAQSRRREGASRSRLRWKIVKVFAGTTLLAGLLMITSLYWVLVYAIQRQVDQRALTIATNLSDTAVTQVLAKNARALGDVLAQYAELKEVAYTLVEDRHGNTLGDSFREFPKELAPILGRPDLRVTRRTPATLDGKKLQDTRVALLNGEIGAVHVGIWQSAVDNEVHQALLPIIGVLMVILIIAVLSAIAVARKITRPILNLAQSADQISKGQLDLPVGIASNDELGELGRSIERLRASLKAAMVRLDHQES
ncbi:MAG TPA: HAMP domain-containing protein [Terriglobales bacterium]|nr:HAMP domain-containing protein [Terriglobales bacterium]